MFCSCSASFWVFGAGDGEWGKEGGGRAGEGPRLLGLALALLGGGGFQHLGLVVDPLCILHSSPI